MRFHVLSLPHTKTTTAYSWCAYTEKVRKFATMLTRLGHDVYLYAADENEAECTELVDCAEPYTPDPLDVPDFTATNPLFKRFNRRAIKAIACRILPKDFICLIGGNTQQPIARAFQENMSVEFGVGYSGVFSDYKVFESYAWMHTVYGALAKDPHSAVGNFYDTVIPSCFEIDQFPYSCPTDYYLFIGRVTSQKGYWLASEVCERIGKRLVIAGPGRPTDIPPNCEYLGVVGPRDRGTLMSHALATFVPTTYIEPFGNVHAESLMCGTPVITTDWGVFTETVVNGINGFRCRTFRQFCDAAAAAPSLDRYAIRLAAHSRFSTDVVGPMYECYYENLLTLWGDGFYA